MFPNGLELSTELLQSLFEKTVTPADFIMTNNRNILAIENQLLVNQSQINSLIQTIQFVQNIHNHQLRHSLVKIQTKYQAYVNLIAEFTNKRREYFLKMMDIITNKQKLLKQIAKSNVREFYNPVKSWVSGGIKNRENIAILRAFLELSLNYTRYRDSRSILNQRLNTLYKAVGDLQTSIMKALQNFVQAKVTVDFNKMKSNNEMLLNKLVLHEGELYNNEKDLFKIEKQYRDVFGVENEYVTMLAPYVGRVNNLFMATTSGGGKLDLGGGDAEAVLSSSAIIPDLRAGDVYSMAGLLQHQLRGCEHALNLHSSKVSAKMPEMIRRILGDSDIEHKMSQLSEIVVNGKLALTSEVLRQGVRQMNEQFAALNDDDKENHRGQGSDTTYQNYWNAGGDDWWTKSMIGRVEYYLATINEIIHNIGVASFGTQPGIYNKINRREFFGNMTNMKGGASSGPASGSDPIPLKSGQRVELSDEEIRRNPPGTVMDVTTTDRNVYRGRRGSVDKYSRGYLQSEDDQNKRLRDERNTNALALEKTLSRNQSLIDLGQRLRDQNINLEIDKRSKPDVGSPNRNPILSGGARRKNKKSVKRVQKGGALIPNNLEPAINYRMNDNIRTPEYFNNMFDNEPMRILNSFADLKSYGLRPLVRPEILNATLGTVVGEIIGSQISKEKTLAGNVGMWAGDAAARGSVMIKALDIKKVVSKLNGNFDSVGTQAEYYFKTIGDFAKHVAQRLNELNQHLNNMWRVHDTYTKNISKVKSLGDDDKIINFMDNMAYAGVVGWVYDNDKPLKRMEKILKEKSGRELEDQVQSRTFNMAGLDNTRLWEPTDYNA